MSFKTCVAVAVCAGFGFTQAWAEELYVNSSTGSNRNGGFNPSPPPDVPSALLRVEAE